MDKIDFKKEDKELYKPSAKEPAIVDVPPMDFLMIDGRGDPNGAEFQEAMQALYGAAYTIKFALKKSGAGPDYVVPPSEGLWWMEGGAGFNMDDREAWRWTLMIRQPSGVTEKDLASAVEAAAEKNPDPPYSRIRLERFEEGQAAQVMHIGPYAEEMPTIERLHAFVEENGYRLRDKHHEIYLSDPRRSAPEKMKTVLRHPVEKV